MRGSGSGVKKLKAKQHRGGGFHIPLSGVVSPSGQSTAVPPATLEFAKTSNNKFEALSPSVLYKQALMQ